MAGEGRGLAAGADVRGGALSHVDMKCMEGTRLFLVRAAVALPPSPELGQRGGGLLEVPSFARLAQRLAAVRTTLPSMLELAMRRSQAAGYAAPAPGTLERHFAFARSRIAVYRHVFARSHMRARMCSMLMLM